MVSKHDADSQTAKDGVLVQLPSGLNGESKTVMVLRFPRKLADGDKFSAFAADYGLYEYVSVLGAKKTVDAYDYGEAVQAPAQRQSK